MAIPFVNATFVRLRERGGLCGYVAYLRRGVVAVDTLPGRRHDHRHLAGDVVHEAVLLPGDAPEALARASRLANCWEAAEPTQNLHADRERFPQPALSLVVALPPDGELTLDEAIELTGRFVDECRAGRRLPAYVVIHEPNLRTRTHRSRNRHAHVLIGLREVDGGGLSRRKRRDLIARVRTAAGDRTGGGSLTFVAEAVQWPALAWALQSRFFLEIGTEHRVQPIAAVPQRHWGGLTWWTEPERVARHLDDIRAENHTFAWGSEVALVEALMRGRSTLPASDLRLFLERCIDGDARRRDRMRQILAHPGVVVLPTPGNRRGRITTQAIHSLFIEAGAVVDRTIRLGCGALCAVRAGDPRAMQDELGDLITARIHATASDGPVRPTITSIVITGAVLSHAQSFRVNAAPPGGVRASRLCDELAGASSAWSPGTLVVVPRAEVIDDPDLARAIILADQRGASLILGVDESCADGIVDRRLAVEIAGRLAPVHPYADAPENTVERLLRAGFIDEAVALLDAAGSISFSSQEPSRAGAMPDGITPAPWAVIDDPKDVRTVSLALRDTAIRSGTIGMPVTVRAGLQPATDLCLGEPVRVTRTEYAHLPPSCREGQIGRVVDIAADTGTVTIRVESLLDTIRIDRFSVLEPAHALTIREARRLPAASRSICVFVSRAPTAWAALLLVACRASGGARAVISPAVARNARELASCIKQMLPGALPSSMAPTAALHEDEAHRALDDLLALATRLPEPEPESGAGVPAAAAPIPITRALPVDLRDRVIGDAMMREGVRRLRAIVDAAQDQADLDRRIGHLDPILQPLISAWRKAQPKGGRPRSVPEAVDLPLALRELEHVTFTEDQLMRLTTALRLIALDSLAAGNRTPHGPRDERVEAAARVR